MFAGSSKPEPHKSLTLQLAPSGDDVAIRQTSNPKKITSFSLWLEAWNVYLSIRIDHAPTRAAELVAYQCIMTSASIQYPPIAWLNYDVQFRMLAASDPNLRTLEHSPFRPVASVYDSQIHTVKTLALYTLWCH